ncbi:MAG: fibronectin type III domain-containing protein [Cyclobacteriaceae bacterium]|nr:fibronectin type III domain-containing protein [Cyclobacteriaceae bacterium]
MRHVRFIIFLLAIVISDYVTAQDFMFLGEGRKDEVRLFWIPKNTWPQNVIGVNIKRRTRNGEWILLNDKVIVPSTSLDKSLENIGLSSNDINALKNKRAKHIQSGQLKAIESTNLIELLGDNNTLKGISLILNSDYDLALIAGFGYVDQQIPHSSEEYEYGLFLLSDMGEENNPEATFHWDYGTNPSIQIPMDGRSRTNKNRKIIELTWEVDVQNYKDYGILNGFNIFRKEENNKFKKLNNKPIWISIREAKSTLYFKDVDVDLDKKYTYAAAPNTIFNTSGDFNEIKVEPVMEIPEMVTPTLQNPQYLTNKIQLNWKFDSDNESYIKGFYVQKKQDDNMFVDISELLSPNVRSFSFDGLPTPDDNYYHFKVIAVRSDDQKLWSNRKIFFHQKQTKPSAPQNISAEIVNEGANVKIILKWDKPFINANEVKEYYLYTSHPNDDHVVKDNSLGKITTENVEYVVFKNLSSKYSFAISAVNDNYQESPLSDKISVIVPSKSLPFINIWPVEQDNNTITLNWKYPTDIADLAGFRLYQNGEIIMNESILEGGIRQHVLSILDPGIYTFEIVAISESGLESNKSKPRIFEVR